MNFVGAADALTLSPVKHPFFAFDNGVGRGKLSPAEQAEILKELGYDGISYNETVDLTNRLAAFRAVQLKIFALYVHGFLDQPERYEAGLTNAVRMLKGTDTIIWLTIRKIVGEHDAEAVKLVQEVADLAATGGLRVALYPHSGFYVATAEDALRVLKQVNRPNVGLTLNLCHELMAGHGDRLPEIIKACSPHLYLVSLNGADRGPTVKDTIKVLGEGRVDVAAFLKLLEDAGYRGPIGLQCYNLPGDPRDNLARSMTAWRKMSKGARP